MFANKTHENNIVTMEVLEQTRILLKQEQQKQSVETCNRVNNNECNRIRKKNVKLSRIEKKFLNISHVTMSIMEYNEF